MAATTLTELPAQFRAGDTLLLKLTLGDYPASDSWAVTYTFRGPNLSDVSFTSSASSDDHLFNVADTTTQVWESGLYQGVARVTNGSQSFSVWSGQLEVLPYLAIQDQNYDARSHARKCLDAIEAVIEGRATSGVLSTTIAGQSVTRMSPQDLAFWRDYYKAEVAQEEEQAAIDAGDSTGRNVLIRFGQP